MSQNMTLGQTAKTLGLGRTGVSKMRYANNIPYVKTEVAGRHVYPRSFVEGLAAASNGIPITRNFVRLFYIIWQYNNQLISSQETNAKINHLRQQGVVLTDKEAATMIGYKQSKQARWRKNGWIRSVRFGRWQLSLASDIKKQKELLDDLTIHEIASILKIELSTALRRAKLGQLQVIKAPPGYRAIAADIYNVAAKQAELAATTYSAAEAANHLGVPLPTFMSWSKKGVLERVLAGHLHRYPVHSIEALAQRFHAINPGFEWLSLVLTSSNRSKVLWPRKRSAAYLGVTLGRLNHLSHQGLLPYFVRTPKGLSCVQRDYVVQYLKDLKAYAAGCEITRTLAQDYLALCRQSQLAA